MLLVAFAGGVFAIARAKGPEWLAQYRRWKINRSIYAQLERTIPMPFPNGIGLAKLLLHVKASTKSADLPSGIPIFVDPIGLQEAGVNMNSTIKVDSRGGLLGETLRPALERAGLSYMVRDGLLTINSKEAIDEEL